MGIDESDHHSELEEDAFAGLIVGSGIEWPKRTDISLIDFHWNPARKKARLKRHAIISGCWCALVPPVYLLLHDAHIPNLHLWLFASPFAIFILSLAGTFASKLMNPAIGLQAPLFIALGSAVLTTGRTVPGAGTALVCYGYSLLVVSLFKEGIIKERRLRLMSYGFFSTVFLIECVFTIVNWIHW